MAWSRWQIRLTACVAMAAALGGAVRAEERPLLWAADESGGAPYVFQDPDRPDRIVGFEADLKDALQKELGRPIEFKHYDFKELVPGLQRGDFDFAMNGLEVLPEYQQQVLFTRPYYVYKLQLAARKGDNRFTTLDDIKAKGLSVGTLTASAAEKLLRQREIDAPQLRSYDDQTGMFEDLSAGSLAAVYIDLPVYDYYLPKYPNLQLVGVPGDKGYYAIAFRKDEAALRDQFDAALGRLIDKDELYPIYHKWGVVHTDQDELRRQIDLTPTEARPEAKYLVYLLGGAVVTIFLSVLGMLLAVALGMPIALMRLYGGPWLRWLAVSYVEFFRGVPVLLLLFFMYYVLGKPFQIDPFTTAVVGLGLNYAAYESEIYRAAIGAIPVGQWEAAASLGMSQALTFRRIILPQALRIILPPMTSDFVALFKDTSVVSVIAVAELTKRYQTAAQSSLDYVGIGVVTIVLYLIMSVPLGFLSRRLERRWGQGIVQELRPA
ncbi:MAG TPA: ABC transporter substrate-binding protein/permease [Gemmataceae bacterium]|nr:ABC transporter substrate-binding protein/permease [Gemmataceae bacterium]